MKTHELHICLTDTCVVFHRFTGGIIGTDLGNDRNSFGLDLRIDTGKCHRWFYNNINGASMFVIFVFIE